MYRILSIILLAGFIFSACEDNNQKIEKKPDVKTVKIFNLEDSINIKKSFSYPAEIYAFQDTTMAFEVNGKIIKFNYKEGQKIKKGDVVAQLDDAIYRANYNASKANYDQALADYKRYKKLLNLKAVSQNDFEKKRQNLQVTKAALNVAKKNLQETKLIAEFDGVIAKKLVDDFERVTAKQPIVRLQDNSSYKIKFFVPENDIQLLKGELSVKNISSLVFFYVTFSNDEDKKYKAKLIDISTTAEKVTRTFEATLQMQIQDDITILPGMTAEVNVIAKNGKENRIFIPYSAVFTDESKKSFVWLMNKENRVFKQEVKLGKPSKDLIEVLSGLNKVSKIVTSGIRFLNEGDKVQEYEKIGG